MFCNWNQIGIDSGSVTPESESILSVSTRIGIGIDSAWLFLHWNRNQFQKFHVQSESIPHDWNQAQVWIEAREPWTHQEGGLRASVRPPPLWVRPWLHVPRRPSAISFRIRTSTAWTAWSCGNCTPNSPPDSTRLCHGQNKSLDAIMEQNRCTQCFTINEEEALKNNFDSYIT